MQRYQILVINPGSTSTKIAVFEMARAYATKIFNMKLPN